MSFNILSAGVGFDRKPKTKKKVQNEVKSVFPDLTGIDSKIKKTKISLKKVENSEIPDKEKEAKILTHLNLLEEYKKEMFSSLNLQEGSSEELYPLTSFKEIVKKAGCMPEMADVIETKFKFKNPSAVQACCIGPILEVFA